MIHMTSEDAALSMLMGVGGEPVSANLSIPDYVCFYDYSTSVQDMIYDGNNYNYGDVVQIPANSLALRYQKQWQNDNGVNCFKYNWRVFQLIIENLDTETEEVVGLIDINNDIEYRFQFNTRGRP